MEPRELNVVDDQQVYSREEIQSLLSMMSTIDVGNRHRQGSLGTYVPIASAFGIVGGYTCMSNYLGHKPPQLLVSGNFIIFRICTVFGRLLHYLSH